MQQIFQGTNKRNIGLFITFGLFTFFGLIFTTVMYFIVSYEVIDAKNSAPEITVKLSIAFIILVGLGLLIWGFVKYRKRIDDCAVLYMLASLSLVAVIFFAMSSLFVILAFPHVEYIVFGIIAAILFISMLAFATTLLFRLKELGRLTKILSICGSMAAIAISIVLTLIMLFVL